MRISLDIKKSIEENASHYFEQAKIARKKAERAKEALADTNLKLTNIDKEISEKEELMKKKTSRKKDWYEKFRWFFTSEGFLVIGGRDATTNEIVIKKHTDQKDIVFHTEMAGSPFVVIKSENKEIGKESIDETADFTACYSKAWKLGQTMMDVFYVLPEQVTKQAQSGEYISKGAFMIYGHKNIIKTPVKLFIGKMEDEKIMAGPEAAVKKNCPKYVEIIQGDEKTSSIAKKIKSILAADDLDDIIKVLPQGAALKNLK